MGGANVKWSWLMYMATLMWSGLIVNDWNNDFKYDNVIEFNKNKTITIAESIIHEPVNLITKNESDAEDLPIPISNVDDSLCEILPNVKDIFEDGTDSSFLNIIENSSWWQIECFWYCLALILLSFCYMVLSTFWRYRQMACLCKKLKRETSVIDSINTLTQQKKSVSKIPTYKFKKSISDANVPLGRNISGSFDLTVFNKAEARYGDFSFDTPLIKEIIDYKKKLLEEEEMCFNLRQELIHLHDERERDRENLSRKLEAVTIEKKELSKQLAAVLKENNALKHDFDEITRAKNDVTRKLNKIKEELRKSTKEKGSLNKEINVLRKEDAYIRQSLENSKREMQRHQHRVTELEKEILQLKSRLQFTVNRKKSTEPLKEKPERLEKVPLKASKCEGRIPTHESVISADEMFMLKPSYDLPCTMTENSDRFDLYSKNVYSRLESLENDIVNWETKNEERSGKKPPEDTQISEIFHSCCDNSNDESSEYGLTSDAFFSDHIVTYYREEEFTQYTDTTPTTSENDLPSSNSEKPSTTRTDELNMDDPALEVNFNEEYNRLMEKIEHTETADLKGTITKQTTFLRKYFQDSSSSQEGFNYLSNDLQSLITNSSSEKLSNKKCRVSVQVYPEATNREERNIHNSLAYKLFTNFDPAWQGGPIALTASPPGVTTTKSPRSCFGDQVDDGGSDLYSLD